MHVRRPNFEFRRPNLSFPPRVFLFKNSIPLYLKSSKTLKHFMKTWFYPSRGLRHPRFHRTVGIPVPESRRVLHSPPLKNIRPRMFLNEHIVWQTHNIHTKHIKHFTLTLKEMRILLEHGLPCLPSALFHIVVVPQDFHHRDFLVSQLSDLGVYDPHAIQFPHYHCNTRLDFGIGIPTVRWNLGCRNPLEG